MRNVFIWLVINAVSAFNLKCPHAGEWNHTAEARNCSSTNYYCLFDDVKLKNAANCSTEPRTERKGFKTVLNKGYFNRKACSLNHFQPFKFSSYKNSECVLEKSLCSEEGQVIADTGTPIRDRSCRCDYLKGYAILANTSNLCSCTPSEEDCTCFKKSCSDTEILSPDYECIKKIELQGIHQCPTISDRGSLTPVTDVVPIDHFSYEKHDKVYILYAATCCTIILVIIIVLSVCVIFCWKQTKRKIWHVWTYLRNCCRKTNFIKQLEDQSCDKGGSVTFTCEVNHKNIPARWSKDEQELKPSESFSITAVGKVHVLVIHSVTAKDSGKYACHIKDKNSSAQLIVKEVIIVKQLEDQNCFEGGSVTFTCEVNHNDIPARWSKNGQELKPSESISITAVGNVHKIVIHSVTATDSGKYACHINDKNSSAQLIVKEVIIVKQLENQSCDEGCSVTFTCEVNHNDIPARWSKNGQELKASESISITAVGNVHKIVIHSVTAIDSGKYACHINDKKSSAQLIVKEVIIIKQLEDQSCNKGGSVTFTCEVNKNDIPARWSKNGQELKASKSIKITAVGRTHQLVIDSVTANDKGKYSCHILDKNSSAQLTVKEVIIVKQLEDQNCFGGGSVTFTCEVNHNDIPARWSKNGQELKPSESISITAVGNVHKIVIHSVTATDSGKFACHINDKNSSAQLTVKEVFISKQLEDQNSFDGGSVTFTCEVNKTNVPGKWNKDGQKLKATKSKRMTVEGRIHKLVIDSITANDKGKYSFHIKHDDSSAQLIVSEVTFINKFKDQKCFEGETVKFTCEVSQKNVPGKWRKDGIELVSSESKKITVIGRTHNLVIHSVTLNDIGYYSFKVTDKASGAHLIIEDTKYIKLCHLLKTVAEPVIRKIFDREIHPDHLKQTLSKGKNKIDKLKKHRYINWREYDLLYPKVVEYSVKFKIKNHDYSQIQGNEEEDKRIRAEILHDVSAVFNSVQGIHKVEILDLESGSLIAVIKLTASQVFDTLKSTIESALKEGKIGSFETDSDEFIFQKLGNLQVPITSQNFDIRLMMILMKNLIEAYDNIPDVLPFETDITEVADLSRVKHIRNKIVQNSDRSISDEDFEEDWSNLSQALIRLGGESVAEECKTLKEYQPTPQQSKDYLNPENLQCDQGSISNESLTDDFVQETLMNNSARYAVRQIFDKQFPPQALQKEIENQKQPLRNLKEHRGITQSQWDDLFPREKESLSSARFDIKVMIILLSNTSFKDKEIFKTIENLQNCLSRPKEYRKAIMQAIKEINEEELSWR